MSLATRCPACATVFRVVQDQLRVSEGWVRCGRCGEVFNAALALVNLDSATRTGIASASMPSSASPSATAPSRSEAPLAFVDPEPEFEPTRPPPGHELGLQSRLLNKRGEPEFVVSDDEPPPAPRDPDDRDDELGRIDLESLSRRAALMRVAPPPIPPTPAPAPPSLPPAPIISGEVPSSDQQPVAGASGMAHPERDFAASAPMPPSFVQTADRAARWQQPRVRRALWWLAGIGVTTLGIQAAAEYRAIAMARWPALRPPLTQLCEWVGCSVDALRQIESLVVESSGLTRIEGTGLYRLSVVLRNKAALELAQPALDLTLTDAQGKVIARRVLSLAEVGIYSRTIPAGAELPIQVAVGVGDRQVVGYTVELFYP